jgi:anti-anti-sigma factor
VTAEGLRETGRSETGLRIEVDERAGWVQVALIGEVDLDEAEQVSRALGDAMAASREGVVADLRPTTFLGSTGVRMLLEADAAARAAGRSLAVIAGEGPARRTLELVGLGARLRLIDPPA